MRQNTWRTARGMFFAGSADSPAATPISSVPWNEKPAIMATPISAGSPPTKGASPRVKLASPCEAGMSPRRMPKIISVPMPMKAITVTTLTSAHQYSASPKPRTEMALSANISPRKSALHSTPGVSGNQYSITSCAAASSTAMVTAQLYQ
ncbi:hypothetical protein D9M68_579840 [compost metagenome]